MEAVIDIGNTMIKLGYFINDGIHEVKEFITKDDLLSDLRYNEIESCIVSSVRSREFNDDLASQLADRCKLIILDHNTPLPINLDYETPATLGRDRIAAAVGARFLCPDANVLAIDAGTCITYEFVRADGTYLGGNISPGITLRSKAMNEYTGALPLVNDFDRPSLIGKSTKEALQNGVMNGMIYEVNGYIESFKKHYADLLVILCGGQARYLVNHINYEIFANRNLVLLGLHKILKHNDP